MKYAITIAAVITSVFVTSACSSQAPIPTTSHTTNPSPSLDAHHSEFNTAAKPTQTETAPQIQPSDSAETDALAQEDNEASELIMHAEVEATSQPETHPILFEFDQSTLTPDHQAYLIEHARYLSAHPDARVSINGHADPQGDAQYNEQLARQRADSVAAILTEQGVLTEQMEIISWGAKQPSPNAVHPRENRRVELDYLDQSEPELAEQEADTYAKSNLKNAL